MELCVYCNSVVVILLTGSAYFASAAFNEYDEYYDSEEESRKVEDTKSNLRSEDVDDYTPSPEHIEKLKTMFTHVTDISQQESDMHNTPIEMCMNDRECDQVDNSVYSLDQGDRADEVEQDRMLDENVGCAKSFDLVFRELDDVFFFFGRDDRCLYICLPDCFYRDVKYCKIASEEQCNTVYKNAKNETLCSRATSAKRREILAKNPFFPKEENMRYVDMNEDLPPNQSFYMVISHCSEATRDCGVCSKTLAYDLAEKIPDKMFACIFDCSIQDFSCHSITSRSLWTSVSLLILPGKDVSLRNFAESTDRNFLECNKLGYCKRVTYCNKDVFCVRQCKADFAVRLLMNMRIIKPAVVLCTPDCRAYLNKSYCELSSHDCLQRKLYGSNVECIITDPANANRIIKENPMNSDHFYIETNGNHSTEPRYYLAVHSCALSGNCFACPIEATRRLIQGSEVKWYACTSDCFNPNKHRCIRTKTYNGYQQASVQIKRSVPLVDGTTYFMIDPTYDDIVTDSSNTYVNCDAKGVCGILKDWWTDCSSFQELTNCTSCSSANSDLIQRLTNGRAVNTTGMLNLDVKRSQPAVEEIFEGVTMRPQTIEPDEEEQLPFLGYGYYGPAELWPSGVIPYVIDATTVSDLKQAFILSAIMEYNEHTCVKFVPRSSENEFLTFGGSESIWSAGVGYRETNFIHVGENCTVSLILRAIMHALGFLPEHTRKDRDRYVTVFMDNLTRSDEKYFKKRIDDDKSHLVFPYDINSVTHYLEAPSNLKWTVRPKDTYFDRRLLQYSQRRLSLSTCDIVKINMAYQCRHYTKDEFDDLCGFRKTKKMNFASCSKDNDDWLCARYAGFTYNCLQWPGEFHKICPNACQSCAGRCYDSPYALAINNIDCAKLRSKTCSQDEINVCPRSCGQC